MDAYNIFGWPPMSAPLRRPAPPGPPPHPTPLRVAQAQLWRPPPSPSAAAPLGAAHTTSSNRQYVLRVMAETCFYWILSLPLNPPKYI